MAGSGSGSFRSRPGARPPRVLPVAVGWDHLVATIVRWLPTMPQYGSAVKIYRTIDLRERASLLPPSST